MTSTAHPPKILVTDTFSQGALAKLQSELKAEVIHSKSKYPTAEELQGVSTLLIRSRTEVDSSLLQKADELKLIVTSTSGFDHIDLVECKKRNIVAMYTPEANPPCAAEITMLLLLSMSHNIAQANNAIRTHNWKDQITRTAELSGQNLGIIGLGRVGGRVAKLAQSFGMSVSAYDPYIEQSIFDSLNVERLGLTELFIQCPIISLHVPLTKETYRIINRATIETMSPGVSIINASRGSVIEEPELVEALESGHIAAAALDVFESEPLPQSSRLRKLKNVFTTPHIGGFSQQAFERASVDAVNKVIAFLSTKETSDTLPPKALWYQATK